MIGEYMEPYIVKRVSLESLGFAWRGLVSTVTAGWKSIVNAETLGGKIVSGIFYIMFLVISGYSVLTTLGYLHKG